MIKMIYKSQNCFYLAFLQIIMHQIQVFWMPPSNTYWLPKDLTSLLLTLESLKDSHFWIHMLRLPCPIIVLARFKNNIVSVCIFFIIVIFYFNLAFYLVLFFIKLLYNELLNFSLWKYISFYPTNICSKLGFYQEHCCSHSQFLLTSSCGLRSQAQNTWRTWRL